MSRLLWSQWILQREVDAHEARPQHGTVGGWSHAKLWCWAGCLGSWASAAIIKGIRISLQGAYEAQISFTISESILVPGVQWSTVLATYIVALLFSWFVFGRTAQLAAFLVPQPGTEPGDMAVKTPGF